MRQIAAMRILALTRAAQKPAARSAAVEASISIAMVLEHPWIHRPFLAQHLVRQCRVGGTAVGPRAVRWGFGLLDVNGRPLLAVFPALTMSATRNVIESGIASLDMSGEARFFYGVGFA